MRCVTEMPSEKYQIVIRRKNIGQSTKEALCGYLAKHEYDILVVGCVGRKGPKDDPHVLGSTADYSLRAARLTSVIVKNRRFPEEAIFLVATDGSDGGHEAVRTALTLARPADRVLILHVEDRSVEPTLSGRYTEPAVRERYEALAARMERVEYRTVQRLPDGPVADTVCAVASDEDATFVVVGVDGISAHARGESVMGSVSDRVVRLCRSTVIVTQQKRRQIPTGTPVEV